MGVFDDYINGLEGQSNIDPIKVASDLHGIHEQELGTREAKITQLTETTTAKDTAIAERDAEILKWKAKNFDLALSLPADNPEVKSDDANGKPDASAIRITDLFKPSVRNRHGR